jgi:peroxiredoxin
MLVPRHKTPDLTLPLVGGGRFTLSAERSARGTLVCFYRGWHSPSCAPYLAELERLTPAFSERGIGTVAVSSDGADRAAAMAEKVAAAELRIAYGLPPAEARAWGLYISAGRGRTPLGVEEPALFPEPGLFLVDADRTLHYASVQNMPFARPAFAEFLAALDDPAERASEARGEHTGRV